MIDGGIDCPSLGVTTDEINLKKHKNRTNVNTISKVDVEREKRKLLETDLESSRKVASERMVNAYQDYSAEVNKSFD
jgi:hypothetical protein